MDKLLVFKVKGNNYNISFPSVGKFRRIESLKQVLSNGTYQQLVSTQTDASQSAADMVDIEASLMVLAPTLIKDLKCDTFEDLAFEDYMELRNAYVEQFSPWWNAVMKEISSLSIKE
jgi:DUF438 domain-containing protein